MLSLILRAVRTRTAQVLTVMVLAALAAAVAAAGPWYATAAPERAAAAVAAAAPAAQRLVSVRQIVNTDGSPQASLDTFADEVRGLLPVPDATPVLGMTETMTAALGTGDDPDLALGFRADFCAHVRLTGTCPAADGEVAMSQNAAQQLGLDVGDRIVLRAGPAGPPLPLRIVARYQLADPGGAYWSNPLFRTGDDLDPLFTPIETFTDRQLWGPTVTYDADVPEALLRGARGEQLMPQLRTAAARLGARQMNLVNPTGPLLETIRGDRATIRLGVLVALVQVLLLAWFAIGLAGRYTVRDRRGDAALLKLRGSSRGGVLALTVGQHLVPLAAGVLLGAPAGWLAARAAAGPVAVPEDRRLAFALSAAAALAVLAGALVVLTAVEAVVLRQPVATLLRRVPPRRRDWRADVVDLALLAVAVAAVYQARSGGPDSGLALVAPALVALAVALLLARLLGRLADRMGSVALRTGRLRSGFAAVQVSRQPGTDRVLALVVVAVAVFATAAGGWSATRTSAHDRGVVELGAARVLTVDADNRTALLSAVRRADPGGRYAMAAVVDTAVTPPVLAVDSARLAAVAGWRPEYGPVGALAAATAVPPSAALPLITGAGLEMTADNRGRQPVAVTVVLQHETSGAVVPVTLGPIRPGRHTVSAPVRGCTQAPGCRLVRWELVRPPGADGRTGPPRAGARVVLRGLTQQDPAGTVVDAAGLGDIGRWRADSIGTAANVVTRNGTLTMAVAPTTNQSGTPGYRVHTVDAVLPLPLVLAGPPPDDWRFGDASLPALATAPARVIGTPRVLPVLGEQGVLVDLDAVRRVGGDATLGGTDQVWLSADAPRAVVKALTAAGLAVVTDESVGTRTDRLAEQGPAVSAWFALLSGGVALLLAAAVVAVAAAVDRGGQVEQFRVLRLQGLPGRVAVTAAFAGLGGLLAAGLAGGLLAAFVARDLGVAPPVFTDGWRVIEPAGALTAAALAGAGLVALVLLAATWALSVLPLVRRLRGGRS
ncbi:FtsX-like permease family protein [Jidongwangia harbinensis]|uniref:FtsX-like permease family protein n=1 Tax=Jidongwangia harbinensis TaxID=2878561 RepID=UPI001CD93F9F|nr:FtsX-like permease family protein [Jidongwangia harbinensis]MCA2216651.1 ABC transporter permease [Jidongwangia harbinensis]